MNFEWDQKKGETNLRKHGVPFDEAATVFLDPMAVSGPDPEHSLSEDRYITFGLVGCSPCATPIGPEPFE